MAKQRYVNTKLWSDTWIQTLDPIEKLLFLYFLTNEKTNIAGIYELPIKIMAVETGIDEDTIFTIFKRFKKIKKAYYIDGWVIIPNFPKHQEYKNSPKIKQGIDLILKQIPDNILYSIDTLSIPYAYPLNYTNTNYNNNTNKNNNNFVSKTDEEKFSFNAFLQEMKTHKARHIQIIRLYWLVKERKYENRQQANAAVRRDLKAASALKGYSDKRTQEVLDYLKENADFKWTLETVGKFIDEDLNKLNSNKILEIK